MIKTFRRKINEVGRANRFKAFNNRMYTLVQQWNKNIIEQL